MVADIKQRTLVVLTHGQGDILMHASLLKACALSVEAKDLTVLVKGEFEANLCEIVIGSVGGSASYILLSDFKRLGRLGRLFSAIRLVRRMRFDSIIIGYGTEVKRAALLSLMSGASERIGPDTKYLGIIYTKKMHDYEGAVSHIHKKKYADDIVRLLGIECDERIQGLDREFFSSDSRIVKSVVAKQKSLIVFALGSGSENHKRLPDDVAAELVGNVSEKLPGFSILLVGGASEAELNAKVSKHKSFRGENLTGLTSQMDLFCILKEASLLVTVCNGVSHYADYVGCPVLAIYGPTNPSITGVSGPLSTIVKSSLPCSPCYSRFYVNGCGNPQCMKYEASYLSSLVVMKIEELKEGNVGLGIDG